MPVEIPGKAIVWSSFARASSSERRSQLTSLARSPRVPPFHFGPTVWMMKRAGSL